MPILTFLAIAAPVMVMSYLVRSRRASRQQTDRALDARERDRVLTDRQVDGTFRKYGP